MSIELHVFFRGELPTKSALNAAMKALGLPLAIKPSQGTLEGHTGLLPMAWSGEETGVEFDVYSDPAELKEIGAEGIDRKFDRCANLRWGGDENELFAAQCLAAAIAKLTRGAIFDPESGQQQPLDEITAAARRTRDDLAKRRKQGPRGSRPADLKHYLKPLLKERSDLVLRGRALFIRPVRHILRGAFFDRSNDPYSPYVVLYLLPLYHPGAAGWLGLGGRVAFEDTWQPYFEPRLMDILHHEVFETVGSLTTLDDLVEHLTQLKSSRGHHDLARMAACRLAGRDDEADMIQKKLEPGWPPSSTDRVLFNRDIEALCAACHAVEGQNAKELKLGDAWEPTPFPVELPKPARRTIAEPAFPLDPWPKPPKNLVVEPPKLPGDTLFARRSFFRRGSVQMLAALTAAEALELHRGHEGYCLAVRLHTGELLMLRRQVGYGALGWSPYDPRRAPNPDKLRRKEYWLYIDRESEILSAEFETDELNKQTLHLASIKIASVETYQRWVFYAREPHKIIIERYHRHEEPFHEKRLATSAEHELRETPVPEFGEYEALLNCANGFLEAMGREKFVR